MNIHPNMLFTAHRGRRFRRVILRTSIYSKRSEPSRAGHPILGRGHKGWDAGVALPSAKMPAFYSDVIRAGAILLAVFKLLDHILYCLANLTPALLGIGP
jgi:hypothetical protein